MAFFTDNAKGYFGHSFFTVLVIVTKLLYKSQGHGGQLVINRASHLYKNCMWLEFQST